MIKLNLLEDESNNILKHHIDNGYSTVQLDNSYRNIPIKGTHLVLGLTSGYVYEDEHNFNFEDDEYGGFGQTLFTGTGTIVDMLDNQVKFYWRIWFDLEGDKNDETIIYLRPLQPELEIDLIIDECDFDEEECQNIIDNICDRLETIIENAILENARYFGYSVESSTIKGRKLDMK